MGNQAVLDAVRELLQDPLVCYGYQKMTDHLRQQGYVINAKKVYRLLKEHKLLLGITFQSSGPRQWVQHRKINALYSLDYLCHDIKYVWIEAEKRNYLLYTASWMCIAVRFFIPFSRKVFAKQT